MGSSKSELLIIVKDVMKQQLKVKKCERTVIPALVTDHEAPSRAVQAQITEENPTEN